jgi:hypothetical protein
MGSTPPYFSVYPLPAKVPTNAAILASQYLEWKVSVVDGNTPIEVRVESFAGSGGLGAIVAIRPVQGWPADRSLEVVATSIGGERRHPFKTSNTSHDLPPTCEWTGPSTIHPKSSTPEPASWPTNMPRPPRGQRTFSMPHVHSPTGYMVAAQLFISDRGRTWPMQIGLAVANADPSPSVTLAPPYGEDFSDEARLIGVKLLDVAGNVSTYGTTT